MRGPQPPAIDLSDVVRQELDTLTRRHTTSQQVALRARIVLAAADGANNGQIARQLAISVKWSVVGASAGSSSNRPPWRICPSPSA